MAATTVFVNVVPPDGVSADNVTVTARPTFPLTWTETSTSLKDLITYSGKFGISLPAVDQAGFVTSAGSPFKNWAYLITFAGTIGGVEFSETRLLQVYSTQTATDFNILESAPTRKMSFVEAQQFAAEIADVNSVVRSGINTVFAAQVTAAQAAQTAAEAARDETIIATSASSDWTGAVSFANGNATIAKSNWLKRQLTGNTTLTMGTGTANKAYTVTLEISQDATGGRTLAWSGVSWAYGVAPTMSTAASARDIYYLTWTGNIWVGSVGAQAVA